jgi:hypothetical protein
MRRLIFLFTFLILVGIAGFVYWYYYNPFGDGTRVGMLQKFSRKGNVFKTYEGELLQEGFGRQGRGGAISAQYFYFSVEEDAVASKLEKLQGQNIKVHYTQYRRALPWRGENTLGENAEKGQFIVHEVEAVNEVAPPPRY